MFDVFQAYIRDENLFAPADKLILAVSGGVDSMVMLTLFQQAGFEFVVAHCNFRLRGTESDGEEVFIRDYCGEQGIELYVKQFDTREYAGLKGISIEMAARELRYEWFYRLLGELSYDYIATAHHQDDLIETMLINLSRGTGIRGLTGIQAKNDRIVRPLLFAGRSRILEFAAAHQIDFKNDSSNDELVYQRNIIRHQIIPQFEELNPAFRKNAAKTASILKQTERIYQQQIDEFRKAIMAEEPGVFKFSIEKLKGLDQLFSVLFEFLHPFGFNASQIQEIYGALDAEAGKIFYSGRYRLVKDRDDLIVTAVEEEGLRRFYIEDDCLEITEPLHLRFELISKSPAFRFSTNAGVADFDYDLLQFPLILKKWEQGEYFQPLGMTGFKKLSDFFIDEKMSIPEKETTWILYSGRQVVWIVGRRIDDRFKITKKTREVFRVSLG
ncbi:tRNA lysidine(34) synthetase TilS [Gaoshiqia sp. Z1-71]|uniref:tRNA lysidine(34) synthetase TilS n=1 Tax=Gaoshiqia hydrogeniformans TaxID=3290090 RepID=UPI003BF86549